MASPGNQHCVSWIGTLSFPIVGSLTTMLYTGCGRKKVSPEDFQQYFPNEWKFSNKRLHAYCVFISTQHYKMLLSYL